MTLLFICCALLVGVVIGATERTVIVNAVKDAEARINARIAAVEEAVKGKL